ncbi:protein of unknown function [Thermococcus nautili]|nr:protein of unknown function [Thermococcus nautili]
MLVCLFGCLLSILLESYCNGFVVDTAYEYTYAFQFS